MGKDLNQMAEVVSCIGHISLQTFIVAQVYQLHRGIVMKLRGI